MLSIRHTRSITASHNVGLMDLFLSLRSGLSFKCWYICPSSEPEGNTKSSVQQVRFSVDDKLSQNNLTKGRAQYVGSLSKVLQLSTSYNTHHDSYGFFWCRRIFSCSSL